MTQPDYTFVMKFTVATSMQKLARPLAVLLFLLIFLGGMSLEVQAKPKPKLKHKSKSFVGCSITGATAVNEGSTYNYNASGACEISNWTVSCGTVQSSTDESATIYYNQLGCTSATITAYNGSTVEATKTVTVTQPLSGGTITTNGTQSINYNTAPSQIYCSPASGGSCTSYTYQWYYSTNNSTFYTISGATGVNYAPGTLTVTTYFKRYSTCSTSSVWSTNTAMITVYPQVIGGSVSPASQAAINYNTSPGQLTLSGYSGGTNSFTYQWYSSPDNSTWSAITGATMTTYSPPALAATTYYEAVVNSNGATASSASALVTVYPQLHSGAVGSSQSINYNTVPATLNLSGVSGGNGSYSYQWYYSTNGGGTWTLLTGVTTSSYSPGALSTTTSYEVVVNSNGVQATSAAATITVYPQLVSGSVSPSSQTINYDRVAQTLSIAGTLGGTGIYSYQWQSATGSGGPFTAIAGATSSSYPPGALTSSTWYEVVTTSNGVNVTASPAVVTVNPQVIPGTITPSSLLVNSGTNPGPLTVTPASGGACSGAFGYQWQSAPDNSTWTSISGATNLTYGPGPLSSNIYYRVRVICGTDTEYTASATIQIGTINTDLNYIRTRALSKPGVSDTVTADGLTSPYDVKQGTTYFDGLGRPIQTVVMQASPLQQDMVTIHTYDPIGREAIHYLPYTSPSNNGNYKTDPTGEQTTFSAAQYPTDQYYYGQSGFDNSPQNRVLNEYAPGNSWVGGNKAINHQYLVNTAYDSVQIWNIALASGSLPVDSGRYAFGQLYKTATADEQGNQVIEFKDNRGKVILKRVQAASSPGPGHSGWLNTYYVYDNQENLRYVIQPQAVALIDGTWTITQPVANELCFRYEYDQRNRVSRKKVPGAGIVYNVYDARDRLIMTQDSNLIAQGKWHVTVFDSLNRPIQTGLLTDPNNQAYHQNLAYNSITYPNTSGGNYEVLTQSYYDDYSWVAGSGTGLPSTMATNYLSNGSDFVTTFGASPTYAVAMTYFPVTRGMVTGTRTEVLGSSGGQYLANVNFYDDRGRVIQTQSLNYTGGVDTLTTQYDFTGKPLRALLSHAKQQNTAQHHTVVTKMDYDQSFRLRHIWKNIDGAASDQLIDSLQYNELGQLSAKYLGNNIDSLIYNYNIRGWLTGINPNYVAGTTNHYFGMELGYDKTNSVAPGNTYTTPEYNGNIEGAVWKSAGSGLNRKFDFTYDSENRLTGAAFLQNTSGSSWDNSQVNFSVSNLSYDLNGNIKTMSQRGFLVGGSQPIDSLAYGYSSSGSNKLLGVLDVANNPTSQLGDFHYASTKTNDTTDYAYDGNGNLNKDNNKAITSITYNYLNLPQLIQFPGKGNISYIYDAAGQKLAKVTIDSVAQHSVRTLYLDGMVYQQTGTMVSPGGATDTLQFISHEEGRVRWAYHTYTTGPPAYVYVYDFCERDHLGNTRMVLTQERDTTNYIATMEAAYRATESQLFANIASTSFAWTSMPNYQNIPNSVRYPTGITVNDSVSKVDYNGTSGQTAGPSLLLKVMAGDTILPAVQCYYVSNTLNTTNSSFTSVLNSLAGAIVATSTGGAEGALSAYTSSSSPVYTGLNSFLTTKDQAPPSDYPKAYLNWIMLDDQFNYVSSSSGSVATASANYPANQMNTVAAGGPVVMSRNGYLYVWVSNETQGWDVFFDNFSVYFKQGPVLEENHYYPFGLTMAGISDKAVKTNYAENKYRYNKGSELQNKEFADGSGLEMYETHLRDLDPQLGRWWQVDPKPRLGESGYASMGNNPIIQNDPLGDTAALFRPNGTFWKFVDDGKKEYSGVFFQKSTVTSSYTKDGNTYTTTEYSKGIKFNFNDPQNDVQAIKNGVINKVQILSDGDIAKQMDRSGVNSPEAQKSPLSFAKAQGVASGKMDYAIQGAYANDLNKNTFYLYNNNSNAPSFAGDRYTAYNIGDIGNFLWGWGIATLGIGNDAAAAGAQYNQIFNGRRGNDKTDLFDFGPGTYGPPGWFDSPDDQRAIQDGWNASPRGRSMSADLLNMSKN